MEPALKQRLLGAAVLVALAVIFLPMVFDGPAAPPPPAGSLPLSVPAAPDRPLQTREIPLTLPARAPSAAATPSAPIANTATPSADPDRLPTVDVPVTPRVNLLDDPATDPPSPVPATTPAAVAPPVATPKPPEVAPPTVPTVATPTPSVAPIAAPTALPAGSRFVVNLGSYSNGANAQALLGRLKASGLRAYSESISLDGKPATRLRAGPFASRAEAESAVTAAKRVQADIATAVIGLESADAAPARPAPAVAGGFVIQVGAFATEAEANVLRNRLRNGGYTTFVERINREGGALWRVRVGPEIARAKADAAKDAIKQRFQVDAQVLSYP